MSYDFELYTRSSNAVTSPDIGPGGQVVLDGPHQMQDEDIATEYLDAIGTRRVLFRIHLEGVIAGADTVKVDAWLRALIVETKGVLIDLQTDTFETTRKKGRIGAKEPSPANSRWMSFFFEDAEGFRETGFAQMLSLLQHALPEALPVRYGPDEPLEHKVENGNTEHLVQMFQADPTTFSKAKAPFGDILVNVPCKQTFAHWHPRHFVRREFLVGAVSIELRPRVFSDPDLFNRMMACFEQLSVQLDVIYSEVTLDDQFGNWFWRGLPDRRASAVCIGARYGALWTDFVAQGRAIGQHHHIMKTDYFGGRPLSPPKEMCAQSDPDRNPGGKPVYAQVFPFDYEFDHDTYIW